MADARQRLAQLWDETGPKSVQKFFDRARREGIPASYREVQAFVKEREDRPNELFGYPQQTVKTFARELNSEWKVDLMDYSHRPSENGDRYVLVRLNAFSREVDIETIPSKSPEDTAEAFRRVLARAQKPEAVLTDLGSEWGGAFA